MAWSLVNRLKRTLRRGEPIVVVSGLPRSGTSMAMMMLQAGGMPILTDGVRSADGSNPKGYFEFEAVKHLNTGGDVTWLDAAGGRAVKIISFLLTWLPETYDYRVIFMQRDLAEVIASQHDMLARRGETPEAAAARDVEGLRKIYGKHLEDVDRFLARRRCFASLSVNYGEAINQPTVEARRINEFLGGGLDVDRMAAVADRTLYRQRRS